MTTLLPWCFYVTANEYWMYKFRDVSQNNTFNRTALQVGFTAYLTVASSIPNTVFLVINAMVCHRISLHLRMHGSLIIMTTLFIITTALVKINTDSWQENFFILTMLSVVFMNCASAIMSGGLFGISGRFPAQYISAVVSGQALGGVFAAVCEIVSLSLGVNATLSALIYFIIGVFVLALSSVAYTTLTRTAFFKYHLLCEDQVEEDIPKPPISINNIMKRIWPYAFAESFIFVATLSVYPGVTVLVDSEYKGNGQPWNDIYFVPVVCYFIFSTGDYVGRIIAGYFLWPKNKPYIVAGLSLIRVIFVPILMMCNAHPRHYLPILIEEDYIYILIITIFALSNGYIANIALIYAPKCVEPHEKETASSIMAAFLGIGLAIGSSLSLIMVNLL
ncbi:equilibrative nucleoside transporter 1-like [Ctenocephalides felis]|nr:equilibrative nucleoside transporter 1-like [Ctenocephalides felis]